MAYNHCFTSSAPKTTVKSSIKTFKHLERVQPGYLPSSPTTWAVAAIFRTQDASP